MKDQSASRRREPPKFQSLVLFIDPDRRTMVLDAQRIEREREISLVIAPEDAAGSAFLAGLRGAIGKTVSFAYGFEGMLATLKAAKQVVELGRESWAMILEPLDTDYGAGAMEIAYAEVSADRLAELRARRILLDEKLDEVPNVPSDQLNSQTFDLFVAGFNAPIRVSASPLPKIYGDLLNDPDLFLAVARLFSVLFLRVTGVVERIQKLELELQESGILRVDFLGVRSRKYVNRDPAIIAVRGDCRLLGATG